MERMEKMVQDIRVCVYTKYKDDYELTVKIEDIASQFFKERET